MANSEQKKTNRPPSPPVYATAYWFYKTTDFLYLENIGLHFGAVKKIFEKQKFQDNNTLFVFSTSLLNKVRNLDKFPEVGKLIEEYKHIENIQPQFEKAMNDIVKHLPSTTTIYGDPIAIASSMLRNHIHPVLIITAIKSLSAKNIPLTEVDGYILLKEEFPYMKIPKTLALEYILRRSQK